ncbi:helix-turn-helix transcriptional regulator [Polymorphospora rubra]|uniref:helix-turn-helix transcriptional regulator n=1 Tax=Polymorphospora rubra TaxID=338584 RepID=UPI0033C74777
MANTSTRMLQLLSLLQTHRYWPGSELADRLSVSERTLRRDIDRLRELGYPVDATRGVAGGYQLQAGAALPPLLLDDEEAVAIAVGLRTAAGGAVEGIAETSVRALAKVVQVLPSRLRRRVDALHTYTEPAVPGGGPTVDAATLTLIAQACRDDERLAFDYTGRGGDPSTRLVEPHRLVPYGRRWYLVAFDVERHDWRTFRVDRLSAARRTGARFRPRDLPATDAAEFVRAGLSSIPTRHRVRVRVQAGTDHVTRVVGRWAQVEAEGEGCVVTMHVDEFDWPVLLLAAIGAEFEVLEPAGFRDHLGRVGRLFIGAAGDA